MNLAICSVKSANTVKLRHVIPKSYTSNILYTMVTFIRLREMRSLSLESQTHIQLHFTKIVYILNIGVASPTNTPRKPIWGVNTPTPMIPRFTSVPIQDVDAISKAKPTFSGSNNTFTSNRKWEIQNGGH